MTTFGVFDDLGDGAGSNGAAAFTDSEAEALLHSDTGDQFDLDFNMVAGHAHLNAFRKGADTGYVSGSEIELRTIVVEERGMTATFFFGQNVDLTLESGVRMYAAGLSQNLATLDLVTLYAAEQAAYVVAGLAFIQQLVEHFNTRNNDLAALILDTNDFDFVRYMDNTTLHTAGSNSTTTGDGEDVFDGHQERLVGSADGIRNVRVNSFHQLNDLILPLGIALQSH